MLCCFFGVRLVSIFWCTASTPKIFRFTPKKPVSFWCATSAQMSAQMSARKLMSARMSALMSARMSALMLTSMHTKTHQTNTKTAPNNSLFTPNPRGFFWCKLWCPAEHQKRAPFWCQLWGFGVHEKRVLRSFGVLFWCLFGVSLVWKCFFFAVGEP